MKSDEANSRKRKTFKQDVVKRPVGGEVDNEQGHIRWAEENELSVGRNVRTQAMCVLHRGLYCTSPSFYRSLSPGLSHLFSLCIPLVCLSIFPLSTSSSLCYATSSTALSLSLSASLFGVQYQNQCPLSVSARYCAQGYSSSFESFSLFLSTV